MAEPDSVVLFLKNGDRITGELVSQNERRVIVRSPVVGRVTIPRDRLDRMEPLVRPPPPNTASAPTNAAPKVAPAAMRAPPAAALATSNTNTPVTRHLLPSWVSGIWTNWHGNVQAGLNLGVGTTDRSTMYVNGSASKKWGRTDTIFTYNAAYGEANGVQNANQMAGTGRAEVEISPNRRTFAYASGAAGYDVIRKIDLEYLGGGGVGYKFIDRPKRVLAGELGIQYQSFNYSTSEDQTTVAVRFGESFTTSIDKLSITQRLGFTPGIGDLSNYQVNLYLTLSYPLFKPLTLNLNIIDQYLSKPAAGVQNNDLQIQTTLGVTF
ncbi:MAG: DUF481 domain-containing protein [Verrucomicrobiales bacterium]|nr:DUF481 domain-containing protein [Verrucomicrobiales bacterium]